VSRVDEKAPEGQPCISVFIQSLFVRNDLDPYSIFRPLRLSPARGTGVHLGILSGAPLI